MSMNLDTIFLIDSDGSLQRVPRSAYDSESVLQTHIDTYPDLLAGDQIDKENPVRWLVVNREVGIPDSEGASDRWAVDHLLLDQYGRPTFVEVKRSKDPRIRREVVGQMLDYAANAQSYWPADRIRAMAEHRYGSSQALDDEILRLLADDSDDPSSRIEMYWDQVAENLQLGRVRLLFVADELPKELRRVVEFLNQQMPLVEVLGVEISQYGGQGLRALVPRVVGQTELTRQSKSVAPNRGKTNRTIFLDSCSADVRSFFDDVLNAATAKRLSIYWGVKGFSAGIIGSDNGRRSIFYGFPPGSDGKDEPFMQVYLGNLESLADVGAIRSRLLATAPFQERGKHTLELPLIASHLPNANQAVAVLWQVVDELTPVNPQ